MPRLLARLIPAIVFGALVYLMFLLIKYSVRGLSSKERTRIVFVAIIAVASIIALLSVTVTSG